MITIMFEREEGDTNFLSKEIQIGPGFLVIGNETSMFWEKIKKHIFRKQINNKSKIFF